MGDGQIEVNPKEEAKCDGLLNNRKKLNKNPTNS